MIFKVSENRDLAQEDDSVVTLYLRKNKNGSVELMSGGFVLGIFVDDHFSIVANGFKYSGIKLGQSI